MAAPHIPNLLSLKGRGPRRPARTDQQGGDQDPNITAKQQDTIVQATDTDANISRLSAVQAGYLQDSFACEFAPSNIPPTGFRRLPIINRGTYARTTAIDKLVAGFLAGNGMRKQIISLGAGTDTRFFRMAAGGTLRNSIYHELDFPENTQKKVDVIRRSKRMKDLLGDEPDVVFSDSEVHSPEYHLHALDLRCLDPSHPDHTSRPSLNTIEDGLSTLIISECCLIYLKPEVGDAIIQYLIGMLKGVAPRGLILYEPINPFDAFGKVMVSNLAARGIVLQSLHQYSSLQAQQARLRSYGFSSGQGAVDIKFVQDHWISEDEKERISRTEMLDEIEELNMLLQHYCVAWGWYDADWPGTWNEWRTIKSQPL